MCSRFLKILIELLMFVLNVLLLSSYLWWWVLFSPVWWPCWASLYPPLHLDDSVTMELLDVAQREKDLVPSQWTTQHNPTHNLSNKKHHIELSKTLLRMIGNNNEIYSVELFLLLPALLYTVCAVISGICFSLNFLPICSTWAGYGDSTAMSLARTWFLSTKWLAMRA